MSERDTREAEEPVDPGVERVARAMTAHPVPDVAARVQARLAQPATAPGLGWRPVWAAAALVAVVVLGLRVAPDPERPAVPATTTIAQSAPPAWPAPARGAVEPAPAQPPAPAARPGVARLPPPVTPAEPWPGDELGARPLRYDPLTAPPLALDTIALDPLERTEPLTIEAAAGDADAAARPGEEETR